MGNLFTVWDRLFGTHVDPDRVEPNFSFRPRDQGESRPAPAGGV